MMDNLLIIVGAAKSGTSMVAGVSRILGVDFGPDLGEWRLQSEDLNLVNHILNHEIAEFNNAIQERVKDKSKIHGLKHPVFMKDEKYLDFLANTCPGAKWVFISRDPMAITMNRQALTPNDEIGFSSKLVAMFYIQNEYANMYRWLNGAMHDIGLDNILCLSYEKCLVHPKEHLINPMIKLLGTDPSDNQKEVCFEYIAAESGYPDIDKYVALAHEV